MQNSYYFEYDSKGNISKTYLQSTVPIITGGNSLLGGFLQGSASNDVVAAYNFPNRYLVTNSVLVEQPYLEVSSTTGSATIGTAPISYSAVSVVVTATLNGKVTTPPTEIDFSIFGSTYKSVIKNNRATFTFNIHPSLNDLQVSVNTSATGYVGQALQIGTNVPTVAISSEQPSGFTSPIIHPSGTGSKNLLTEYWTSVSTDSAFSMIDISTIIGVLSDAVFGQIIPQMQSTKTITLDSNQTNLATFMKNSILPVVPSTMETAAPQPASGAEQQFDAHFGHYQATQIGVQRAMQIYAQDLQDFTDIL